MLVKESESNIATKLSKGLELAEIFYKQEWSTRS